MRMVGILVAGTATLALLGAGPVGAAPAKTKIRSCRSVDAGEILASHVRTEYRCPFARTKLSALLGNGVRGIPTPKARSGKWGCSGGQVNWTCRKYTRHPGKVRIRFHLKVVPGGGSGGGIQKCVNRWNADGVDKSLWGFHFYTHHHVRRMWVFQFAPAADGSLTRCALIAVPVATDPYPYEYGTLGVVSTPSGGWTDMNQAPELGDPKTVQDQAAGHANATLTADGSVTLDSGAG